MLDITIGSYNFKTLTIPFLEKPIELATDVTTLGGKTYTDFYPRKLEWEINFAVLS